MRINFRPLQLLVITLAATALLFAQQMTRVRGTIKGTDGKPLDGAEVQFVRTDIKANYKVKSNKKGEFDYPTLPLGTYNITIVVKGQPVWATEGLKTNPAEPIEIPVDLAEQARKQAELQAQAQQAAAAGAPAAPAANPTEGMSEEERKKYEEAMKAAEEASKKDAALQESFNNGMLAVRAKDWGTAIDNLAKAGEIDPMQIAVWGNLAEAYMQRGATRTGADRQSDYDNGVIAYEKAVALKPEDPAYHNNLGLAYAKAGKMPQAEAELGKAAELDPTKAGTYYFNLGALLYNTNQSKPAEAAFRKAIEKQPNHADSWFQLGSVLIAQATVGQDGSMVAPAGTKEAFEKYLQLAPQGANVDAAQGMLQALGATIETNIGKKPEPAPAKKK